MNDDQPVDDVVKWRLKQLEKKDDARTTREWFIIGGIILALFNGFLDRFAGTGPIGGAEAIVRFLLAVP